MSIQVYHSPCSPDLVSSDYYLFHHLKRYLRRRCFSDDIEMQSFVQKYFGGHDKEFYRTGLQLLTEKWQMCIELRGDHIKK